MLGADHGLVGGYLLGLWGLPGPVVAAVTLHHRIEDNSEPAFSPALAVHVADALWHRLQAGSDGEVPAALNLGALERAGMLDRLDHWQADWARTDA